MDLPFEDLWPAKVDFKAVKSPRAILNSQKLFLKQRTGGVLDAEVVTDECDGVVTLKFILEATSLDQKAAILTVEHSSLNPYPCKVFSFALNRDHVRLREKVVPSLQTPNQAEFVKCLTGIFGSDLTIAVIESLIARVKDKAETELVSSSTQEMRSPDAVASQ